VYTYLTPTDLLNLARTNKENHRTLRSRRSILDWARARENIDGLPPCPPWRSEMEFAALISDDCCQV
ncbi:hypothetical protein OH76DRAFT_1304294, partial [Lentinus brumalis]